MNRPVSIAFSNELYVTVFHRLSPFGTFDANQVPRVFLRQQIADIVQLARSILTAAIRWHGTEVTIALDDSFSHEVTISAFLILIDRSPLPEKGLLWLHGFHI